MTVMADLAALQQVDSEIDRLQRAAADLRARIADDAALRRRHALRDAVATSLHQHQLTQRRLEGESASETEEIRRREVRLNSPSLRSVHEYEATQSELEQHGAKLRELEDSLLAAMEDVEVTARRLRGLDEELVAADAERRQQVEQWRQELGDAEAQVAAQETERTRRLAPITPAALGTYTRLRQQKGGRAVSIVQGTVCGACRVTIPPPTLAKARPGVAFVPCDNCGRLLYVPR